MRNRAVRTASAAIAALPDRRRRGRVRALSTSPMPCSAPVARRSTSSRPGRRAGSLARQRDTSARSGPGTPVRSGSWCTTAKATAIGSRPAASGSSKGLRPDAAKASTPPSANTSVAGDTAWAAISCSGAMKAGVPTIAPLRVSARLCTTERAIPKSMTRTPSSASRTLAGFRSRCTIPCRWMSRSASASCPASRTTSATGSGPPDRTRASRESPATYWVASQGGSPSGSASTTGAVKAPLTFRAAATSRRNRARKCGSSAYSGRITFSATRRPAAVRARYTTPIPPAPRRRSTVNSPIRRTPPT